MTDVTRPVLHRDNPDRAPLAAHVRATREDWLAVARDTLVRDGVEQVKVLSLAERMEVSRSSFYWYFKNRDDLLAALLSDWEARNTTLIVEHCEMRAENITQAICNFFRCFIQPTCFDRGLDFAVREWSRRDEGLRTRVDAEDAARIDAVTAMFTRHGYDAADSDARARILYFMQLGYHAIDVREPMETRLSRVPAYLRGFSGQEPDEKAVDAFLREIRDMKLP